MKENKISVKTKQSLGFDIVTIIFVLIIPLSFIFFSNKTAGIFIGIVFLAFFLYGITLLYNKLYRKSLIITENGMIYEDKYFFTTDTKTIDFNEIDCVKIEQTFFNKILNIGKLILKLHNDKQIFLININDPDEIKKLIDSLIKNKT